MKAWNKSWKSGRKEQVVRRVVVLWKAWSDQSMVWPPWWRVADQSMVWPPWWRVADP